MKDILSYDEMKEKLEKIEIPNSVIDRVNGGLEKLVSTDCRYVWIQIGNGLLERFIGKWDNE